MILEVDDLSHAYTGEQAVEAVSLGVGAGELVGLLGPSGCGKTTLVQAIAGHIRPQSGAVILRDEDVTDAPPEARQVGLVFQQSTLYPHMTIGQNVGYGLTARGYSKRDCKATIAQYLNLVSLTGKRDAYPHQLSGGEQRRAELARALAPEPDVLLLDEPLSALDRSLRTELQGEIRRIQRQTGVSMLFVTHDQGEAMALADRIVVMNDGRISGRGSPRALFESPPTPFIASFLGRSNELLGTVLDSDPLAIEIGATSIPIPRRQSKLCVGSNITCHIRPQHLNIVTNHGGSCPVIPGEVTDIADLGIRYEISVRLDGNSEVVVDQFDDPPAVGDEVSVSVSPDRIVLFPT